MRRQQPPALMLSLPALLKGILYDDDCLAAAWDLVKRWSFPERLALTDAAHKVGLDARAARIRFQELGLRVVVDCGQGVTNASTC